MPGIVIVLFLALTGYCNGGALRDYNYDDYWGLYDSAGLTDEGDDKVYRFMLGDNWGAYEYLDSDGFMKGFHPDLIRAVCQKAGKTCYYTVDTYQNCWSTEGGIQLPGPGLMAGWYDACVGLFPTPERQNSFNFTKSWTPAPQSSLFYRKGDIKGDPSDLRGRKIGLVDGWALNKRCLSRQLYLTGNQPDEYEAVYYSTVNEIVNALLKKEIDAFLLGANYEGEPGKIQRAGPFVHCTTGGTAAMLRYGDPTIDWWNAAFDEMVESGEFDQLCKTSQRVHGARGLINCI